MNYFHKNKVHKKIDLPVGKVLCVGRNYAKHALELGNEIPGEPLFFMKPKSALCDLEQTIRLLENQGEVHYETEIAVLIKNDLKQANARQAEQAIWGYGLAFDLTLRDLQKTLKAKGHPWEKAKAFDGAAPVSRFLEKELLPSQQLIAETHINHKLVQHADTNNMLWSIPDLLSEMSQHFSLQAGDIVLTGTPEGVGALNAGDELGFSLKEKNQSVQLEFSTLVIL